MTASRSPASCSQAWKKPNLPSSTVGGPVKPSRTRSAAETAAWAAQPQCIRLTVPPVRLASMIPAAMDAATPRTWVTRSASDRPPRVSSRAAATAPPMAPQIDVACWPCSKKIELPASSS